MPQDIPVEASEELVFTPPSLREKLGDDAPTFTLRAATTRDKRYHRRLQIQSGLAVHTDEAMRAELLTGLAALWSEDAVAKHAPLIKAYWEAQDDYDLQRNAHNKEQACLPADQRQPYPEFEYDQEIVDGIMGLSNKVARAWPPYKEMVADNDEFNDLMTILMVATYVKGWTGIDTQLRRAGGYITVDCAETLRDAVNDLERQHDLPDGVAWLELFIACSKRLRLDEETEKNSASPSPSGTTPPASNETKASEPAGTSPASASSSETPAAA